MYHPMRPIWMIILPPYIRLIPWMVLLLVLIHGYSVCIESNWVRHDNIYFSFLQKECVTLSLLPSAYHPCLGWSLQYIVSLQFNFLFQQKFNVVIIIINNIIIIAVVVVLIFFCCCCCHCCYRHQYSPPLLCCYHPHQCCLLWITRFRLYTACVQCSTVPNWVRHDNIYSSFSHIYPSSMFLLMMDSQLSPPQQHQQQ